MTTVKTMDGGTIDLGCGSLGTDLDGEVLEPGVAGYDGARRLWNGLHDHVRPGLIARCASIADVQHAVAFAADHDLATAVRGGGHNVAGTATTDGGLVIDLGPLTEVQVDVDGRRASVGGGATWCDVDAATQQHGLATPGGVVSDTGVGGLTLGGGIGWLRRSHGLSCDNLVGAQLVTADGDVRELDRDDEVLWALRGGGGGLGVVTRFDFALHRVGPEVAVAFTLYHGERTREVLEAYRELTGHLHRDVSSFAILGTVPDDEEFPVEAWGEPYVMLMACASTADVESGSALVQPFADLGDPMVDMTGPMPYVDLQQALDADYPAGDRYYWKSLHLPAMTGGVVDLAVEWAGRRASTTSTLDIWHLGGAVADVGPEESAFGDRSDEYLLGAEANWVDPATDSANIRWTRRCVEAFAPHSSGREYLNFPGFFESGERMHRTALGAANYERLQQLRKALDPGRVFLPTGHAGG